ncbi:MAG: hypothetical protein H0T89_10370 [Deltaproteobacteria bacterium]|nr:hypothetical protein [Deltaproteobacteria bacterium]MDQ3296352.1 hypothetical protein [Myxococcota bacterium]
MMGIPRRILATVMASMLIAGTVAAQPAPTDSQKQQAGDLTKKAIAKSQAGDHEDAIELYLEAYAIVPLPVLLSNVGAEYQKLGKPVESLKYFCMYLDKDPTGQSATYATAQAKTLQIELGNTGVTDADVCRPQKPVESVTPDPVVEARLGIPALPPAQDTSSDGGKTLRLAGLGIGGAGVVALGLGVYFGLEAKEISDEISNHPMTEQWREDIRALEAKGQSHENKQIAFMVAGGALVATGTVLFFIGRSRRSSESSVAVTPTASPDGMGLVVSGGF